MSELEPAPAPAPLPDLVTVTQAFAGRMPTQRVIDAIEAVEHEQFGDLVQRQPMRVVAFRALLRDHPGTDPTAAWLHSYDVEVAIAEVDPTSPNGTTPAPPSAPVSGVGLTT